MGEILNTLIEQRARLIQIKAQVQNFNMSECNQKINKLTVIIDKIIQGGWDS